MCCISFSRLLPSVSMNCFVARLCTVVVSVPISPITFTLPLKRQVEKPLRKTPSQKITIHAIYRLVPYLQAQVLFPKHLAKASHHTALARRLNSRTVSYRYASSVHLFCIIFIPLVSFVLCVFLFN